MNCSIDVRHMPQGCGTWPAFWETDVPAWPNGGEVDIVSATHPLNVNHQLMNVSRVSLFV